MNNVDSRGIPWLRGLPLVSGSRLVVAIPAAKSVLRIRNRIRPDSNKFAGSESENFYINLIVKRGNINLLKLIKKYNGNLHDEDETIIHLLGLYGFTDCLEYVINDCSNDNWKTIINTNAYNNCINTKKIINNLLCV